MTTDLSTGSGVKPRSVRSARPVVVEGLPTTRVMAMKGVGAMTTEAAAETKTTAQAILKATMHAVTMTRNVLAAGEGAPTPVAAAQVKEDAVELQQRCRTPAMNAAHNLTTAKVRRNECKVIVHRRATLQWLPTTALVDRALHAMASVSRRTTMNNAAPLRRRPTHLHAVEFLHAMTAGKKEKREHW